MMKRPGRTTRRGMTLLELMLATAMTATVMTSVSVLIRTSYAAWQAHEGDLTRIESAHGTLRHIVRKLRQADSVTAITAKTETAGSLSVLSSAGDTLVWARNSGTDEVKYGVDTASDLLAENIAELTFTGYKADGTTETTVASEIQLVKCTAKVNLPRDTSAERIVTCWGWVRSW